MLVTAGCKTRQIEKVCLVLQQSGCIGPGSPCTPSGSGYAYGTSECFFATAIAGITGSAVALHCCKAHAKSIGKMGNSTPCKIVTPTSSCRLIVGILRDQKIYDLFTDSLSLVATKRRSYWELDVGFQYWCRERHQEVKGRGHKITQLVSSKIFTTHLCVGDGDAETARHETARKQFAAQKWRVEIARRGISGKSRVW